MPSFKITKLFFSFFLWISFAYSQNYPVNTYTAANRLPNNSVRSLLIDSHNVLWIGTENGVVKKENDDFKYFFEEDGLALNSCWAIAEDPNGNIWFGSYGGGVSVYDGFKFRVVSETEGLIHNEITQLFSHGPYMYVGTSDGVSRVNINTFEVLSFDHPSMDALFRVMDFFEYKEQVYVITYRTGLHKIDEHDNLVQVNDHTFIYSAFVDKDSIYSSNKGYFSKNSLDHYVSKKDSAPLEELGSSIIWDYVKTGNDRLFAAAWGIYDPSGGIYEIKDQQFVPRASDFQLFSKEVVTLAYDSTFNRLYAGTKDAGLFEISLDPQVKFHEVRGKDVLGFARTKNSSAVLLNDALVLENGDANHRLTLPLLKKWQENYLSTTPIPLPRHKDDFYELDYSTEAQEIKFYDLKAHRDTYWANTNIGLFAITESGELAHYLPLHTEEINFTPSGNLIETNPYGGVRIYNDLEDFEFTHFNQEKAHTPTMVVSSLQKKHKTYFLSIFSGLYVWENGTFTSYLEKGIWKEKKLKHITPLEDNIAVSTEFGDIFIFNDDQSFQLLNKIPRAKIQGNTISFLKSYKGALIIGTEKGLTVYDNDRYIFLDKEQGLEQPLLSAEVEKNILKVGTTDGFYTLNIDSITSTEALVERIKLKEITVNNNEFSLEPHSRTDPLTLSHNENSVLLTFSANAHPYPNKLKYQYRLQPNERWSPPALKPEIFLPSLPPGNYDIAVRVFDESTGLAYTRPLISLAILPPFWKTWWFVLLIIGTVSIGVFSIYRFQIRQTQKFEKQKGLIQKRLEETKMEALLAQMNPHFIFNAMNSIQYYIMENDIDNATIFLGDFAKLIRLNLDHCSEPIIALGEEIEYLQSYIRVENTRFNNTIKVIFETDPAIDPYQVEIPSMLLQTFVENVFVHAFPTGYKNPVLKVSFKLIGDHILQCTIADNGIGFSSLSSNPLHESKGLSLVKERLSLLGYNVEETLDISTVKHKGTTVKLQLRVKR